MKLLPASFVFVFSSLVFLVMASMEQVVANLKDLAEEAALDALEGDDVQPFTCSAADDPEITRGHYSVCRLSNS